MGALPPVDDQTGTEESAPLGAVCLRGRGPSRRKVGERNKKSGREFADNRNKTVGKGGGTATEASPAPGIKGDQKAEGSNVAEEKTCLRARTGDVYNKRGSNGCIRMRPTVCPPVGNLVKKQRNNREATILDQGGNRIKKRKKPQKKIIQMAGGCVEKKPNRETQLQRNVDQKARKSGT